VATLEDACQRLSIGPHMFASHSQVDEEAIFADAMRKLQQSAAAAQQQQQQKPPRRHKRKSAPAPPKTPTPDEKMLYRI
jgi:hypothetical protein